MARYMHIDYQTKRFNENSDGMTNAILTRARSKNVISLFTCIFR